MKNLTTISVRFWLPIFVAGAFVLLLTVSSLWRSSHELQKAEEYAINKVKHILEDETYRLKQLFILNAHATVGNEIRQVGRIAEIELFALIDSSNQVLYSSNPILEGHAFSESKTGFSRALIQKVLKEGNSHVIFDKGHDYILSYHSLQTDSHSRTSTLIPHSTLILKYNLKEPKINIKKNIWDDFLIHLGFTLIFALGLISFVHRWFTRPLITLQEAVNRISKGDFSADVKLTGQGELAALGKDIEHMQQARHLAEHTLHETEQYFQDTFRLMPAALALHTEQGVFIDCSDAFCAATGYSREETIGRKAMDLNLWAQPKQRVSMRAKLERDGFVESIEYQLRHRSGRTTVMQMSARYLMIGGERLLLSVAHDIAKRKIAELALHESEKRFKDTFRLMPAALALHSEQGVFIDCSEDFCQATGYSRDAMIGQNALDLELWAIPEQRKTMRETLLQDGQIDNFEYLLKHRSGKTTMMEMSARHLLIGGEKLLLSFAHDISARKKADADLLIALNEKTLLLKEVQESETVLREAKLAAEVANKSKSVFLASMSHEIRTPINGVLGLTELLSVTKLNAEQQQLVQTILTSGNALLTILNDILDLSKMEAGKMEIEFIPYQPLQLLRDVIDAMSVLANQKNIEIHLQSNDDVPTTACSDPMRIRQILFNLIGNAVKFTQEGGVTVALSVDNGYINFSIEDTGVGIAKENQPLLFQMFTQENASTSRSFGGSGLGLAITKQLVTLMGGDITFESEKNIGSTFSVKLPLVPIDGDFALVNENPQSENALKRNHNEFTNCRILLVDDNDVNLMVAGGMLKNLGLPFDIARSGREAIDKNAHYTYDLILMDCEMPEMDGYDTTRVIRKTENSSDLNPEIPIVALTANAMNEDKQRCLDSGMNGFLSKPINIERLHSILSEFIFSNPKSDRRKKIDK